MIKINLEQNHSAFMGHFFTNRETSMIAEDLAIYQEQDIREQPGHMEELLIYPDAGSGKQFSYTIEWMNPVPVIENIIIQLYETAQDKQINIQVHVPPDDREIAADGLFFRQIFFRFFMELIDCTNEKNIISVYLTGTEMNYVIEAVNLNKKNADAEPEAYFKKHRISNAFQKPAGNEPDLFRLYQYILEDMDAELRYNFNREQANYFRIKFSAGRG